MKSFSRRDFLKLAAAVPGSLALARLLPTLNPGNQASSASTPGILIFVFDAMTARNLSLYGYPRRTTPNLERLAARSTVYHAHYSAGTFTSPGVASLLTGLYPWTHRAFNLSGLIARSLTNRNIFRAIGSSYHRLAFSQNMWPNYFLTQFGTDLDRVLPPSSFASLDQVYQEKLGGDRQAAQRALDDFLFYDGDEPTSLVFGVLDRIALQRTLYRLKKQGYPLGLPRSGSYPIFFRIEDVLSGLLNTIDHAPGPLAAYFHLYPPHSPYRPTKPFYGTFRDGWVPPGKPDHILGDHVASKTTHTQRQRYDEYIASLDDAFGRFLDILESQGILDKNYLILTSDHGEMFERGVTGHDSPLLYDPGVQVPLIVTAPGQSQRQDVTSPTVHVDILPTMVHLAGGAIPEWAEGEILPGLGGRETAGRSIFTMYSTRNSAFAPLTKISLFLRKDKYKLIYYKGFNDYNNEDRYELYDMEADREEINDLYPSNPPIAARMREELLAKLAAVNAEYNSQLPLAGFCPVPVQPLAGDGVHLLDI